MDPIQELKEKPARGSMKKPKEHKKGKKDKKRKKGDDEGAESKKHRKDKEKESAAEGGTPTPTTTTGGKDGKPPKKSKGGKSKRPEGPQVSPDLLNVLDKETKKEKKGKKKKKKKKEPAAPTRPSAADENEGPAQGSSSEPGEEPEPPEGQGIAGTSTSPRGRPRAGRETVAQSTEPLDTGPARKQPEVLYTPPSAAVPQPPVPPPLTVPQPPVPPPLTVPQPPVPPPLTVPQPPVPPPMTVPQPLTPPPVTAPQQPSPQPQLYATEPGKPQPLPPQPPISDATKFEQRPSPSYASAASNVPPAPVNAKDIASGYDVEMQTLEDVSRRATQDRASGATPPQSVITPERTSFLGYAEPRSALQIPDTTGQSKIFVAQTRAPSPGATVRVEVVVETNPPVPAATQSYVERTVPAVPQPKFITNEILVQEEQAKWDRSRTASGASTPASCRPARERDEVKFSDKVPEPVKILNDGADLRMPANLTLRTPKEESGAEISSTDLSSQQFSDTVSSSVRHVPSTEEDLVSATSRRVRWAAAMAENLRFAANEIQQVPFEKQEEQLHRDLFATELLRRAALASKEARVASLALVRAQEKSMESRVSEQKLLKVDREGSLYERDIPGGPFLVHPGGKGMSAETIGDSQEGFTMSSEVVKENSSTQTYARTADVGTQAEVEESKPSKRHRPQKDWRPVEDKATAPYVSFNMGREDSTESTWCSTKRFEPRRKRGRRSRRSRPSSTISSPAADDVWGERSLDFKRSKHMEDRFPESSKRSMPNMMTYWAQVHAEAGAQAIRETSQQFRDLKFTTQSEKPKADKPSVKFISSSEMGMDVIYDSKYLDLPHTVGSLAIVKSQSPQAAKTFDLPRPIFKGASPITSVGSMSPVTVYGDAGSVTRLQPTAVRSGVTSADGLLCRPERLPEALEAAGYPDVTGVVSHTPQYQTLSPDRGVRMLENMAANQALISAAAAPQVVSRQQLEGDRINAQERRNQYQEFWRVVHTKDTLYPEFSVACGLAFLTVAWIMFALASTAMHHDKAKFLLRGAAVRSVETDATSSTSVPVTYVVDDYSDPPTSDMSSETSATASSASSGSSSSVAFTSDSTYACKTDVCVKEAEYLRNVLGTGPCDNFYDYVCKKAYVDKLPHAGVSISADAILSEHLEDIALKHLNDGANADIKLARDMLRECQNSHASDHREEMKKIVLFYSNTLDWPLLDIVPDDTPWKMAGRMLRDLGIAALLTAFIETSADTPPDSVIIIDAPFQLVKETGSQNVLDKIHDAAEQIASLTNPPASAEDIAEDITEVARLLGTSVLGLPHKKHYRFPVVVPLSNFSFTIKPMLEIAYPKDLPSLVFGKSSDIILSVTAIVRGNPTSVVNYLGFWIWLYFAPYMNIQGLSDIYPLTLTVPPVSGGRHCSRLVERAMPMQYMRALATELSSMTPARMFTTQVENRFLRQLPRFSWLSPNRADTVDAHVAKYITRKIRVAHFFPFRTRNDVTWAAYENATKQEISNASGPLNRVIATARTWRQEDGLGSIFNMQAIYRRKKQLLYIPVGIVNVSLPTNSTMFVFHVARYGVRIYRTLLTTLRPSVVGQLSFSTAYETDLKHMHRCLENDFRDVPAGMTRGISRVPPLNEVLEQTVAVMLTYDAFKEMMNTQRLWGADFRLQGLEALTSDQLFFVMFAMDNCERSHESAIDRQNAVPASLRPSLRQSMEAVNQILTYVEIRVGGDLLAIVDLLEAIAEASKNGSSQLNATNAVLIGQDTADTADKLLTHDDPWIEVPLQTRLSCATTLLETVDGAGILLSASGRRNFLKKNFKMNIVSSASRNVLGEVITLPQDGKVSTLSTGTVQIHLAANKQSPKLYNQTVVIVYTEFPRLDRILGIQEDENYCCGELRQELNSPVISARVGTEISSTLHLAEHVIITVPMLQRNARHPTCVFWDTIINDWSPEGCEVESQNGTHVVCLCRHLSNFAVLMDIHGVLRDTPHGQSLAIITSVGCSISIMCLGFCIIIFGGFRALRNTRTSIHLNVCLSLFAAELVLLYGMDQTENKTVCAVMAGVLHYSFLSAFSWMLLEGFHITFLLVKVFNTSRQRPLRYYAFGYGLPLIIVATTALIRPHGYGTSQHCWLSHQDGVFWSYTGPVAFILLVNIAVLLFTIRTTSRLSKATTANARAETARRWIRTTVIMLPLLGLTWIPGFLLFDDSTGSVVMTYFFCVLNSLQGFGFFLFHCALNRSVRRVLLNKLESVQCVRRYVNSRLRRSSTSDERYTSSSLSSDGRMIATIFGRRRSLSFDTTDSSVDDPMAGKFTPTLVTSGVLPYYASGDLIKEEPEKK
ncbi:uncharacterized protein LOC135366781 isoform X1 [Ornithodoros turicata]|uniref:uncharacterized protein LOC135366781 isoform X1 n=1 Tax=Ornithodoros turicata TaxID=34597 RepID=UPI003138BBCB